MEITHFGFYLVSSQLIRAAIKMFTHSADSQEQAWLGLQMDYELDVAEDSLEAKIEKEVTPMSATG
jgi:plasmid maintenance system antidote protein VapI